MARRLRGDVGVRLVTLRRSHRHVHAQPPGREHQRMRHVVSVSYESQLQSFQLPKAFLQRLNVRQRLARVVKIAQRVDHRRPGPLRQLLNRRMRVNPHSTIEELAKWSRAPVINALSDLYHPCQALADVQTLQERFGKLEGLKLAFIGDGNNVAHSLMLTAGRLGVHVAVATPEGYEPNANIAAEASRHGRITLTRDPAEALAGAHAVYTDVWTSMGQEAEAEARAAAFAAYQVNEAMFAQARPDAIFMHCLPARRGEEVADAVIESKRSAVFDQAENRLHAQKALLVALLQERTLTI